MCVSSSSSSSSSDEDDDMCDFARCFPCKKKNMFEGEEETSKELNPAFAKIVDGALRRRPGEEAVNKLLKMYPRPANVPGLSVPRTNPEVWESMHRGAAIADGAVQRIQGIMARACSASLQLVDAVGGGDRSQVEDHLEEISDIVRGLSASFSALSQVRKDIIRNDLGDPVAKLCTWETKVGQEFLFEGDVGKAAKERDSRTNSLRRKKKAFR